MGKNKSKKRSLSESERVQKDDNKDSINPSTTHKKSKLDNVDIVENGDTSIKVVKMKKHLDNVTNEKNDNVESALSPTKSGLSRQEKKSLQRQQSILLNREKRKSLRREVGQYSIKNINFSVDELKEKIKEIKSRENLSKTAIRKLAVLKKKLAIEEGTSNTTDATENKNKTLVKGKEPGSILRIKKSESDDSDKEPEEESNVQDNSTETEKKKPKKNKKKKKKDAESVQDSKNKKSTLDDQEKADTVTQKDEQQNAKQISKQEKLGLIVQNLPFSATVEDIKNHFLTKVASIKSVKIPLKRGLKVSRGHAFIEFENSEDCEKALSLHSTVIQDRQISVQYSTPGYKNQKSKKTVIAKNKKLSNFRKPAKLGKK